MRSRQLRATIIFGVVFAALAFWVMSTQRGRVPEKAELLGLQHAQVSALQITLGESDTDTEGAPGDVVRLEKHGDEWWLTAPVQGLADPDAVERMVREFAQLEVGRRPDVDPLDPKFGLDKPVLTVEGWWDGGVRSVKLTLGGEAPIGATRYATVDGRPGLYLVPAVFRTAMHKSPDDLRDRRLWRISPDAVTQATVTIGDASVTVARQGSSVAAPSGPASPAQPAPEPAVWRITDPVSAPADSAAVGGLARALLSAEALEFAPWPKTPAEYGFDRPQVSISLRTSEGETETFVIGKTSTRAVKQRYGGGTESREVVFAMREGRDEALLLEATILGDLRRDEMALRDRRIARFGRDRVTGLQVQSREGYPFQAILQGAQWRLASAGNAPLPSGGVETILADILALQAIQYVETRPTDLRTYGLATPRAVVTITLGNQRISISYGDEVEANPGLVYALTSEGSQVYAIAATALQSLPNSLEELQSGPGPMGDFEFPAGAEMHGPH